MPTVTKKKAQTKSKAKTKSKKDEEPGQVLATYPQYKLRKFGRQLYLDVRKVSDPALADAISYAIEMGRGPSAVDNYDEVYPLTDLVDHMGAIQGILNHPRVMWLEVLKNHVATLSEAIQASFQKRKEKGEFEFHDLPMLFPLESEVVVTLHDGTLVGGIVKSMALQHGFFMPPYYNIGLKILHAQGGTLSEGVFKVPAHYWKDLIPAADIPVTLATPDLKAKLAERGKIFVSLCKPGSYASYIGPLVQPSYWASRTYRADGRVVIDPVSFHRINAEGFEKCVHATGIESGEQRSAMSLSLRQPDGGTDELNASSYWRCIPWLHGFSLAVKQWGQLNVEGLKPVEWRDNAFDRLVIPSDDKQLIRSLVEFHGHGFTDLIEGKGGGCIFLLHGQPGLGKTASAEAVAEILHRPLYAVGVGELGVNPNNLEEKLRSILDVATIWNAVILLDEADIFLEARDEKDVHRNAMVGVFLRLLEYHNGVLFLTTNRVKNIDKAFYSRISVALHYEEGDEEKRIKIWENLLEAAEMPKAWATSMGKSKVNGRQIKNAIRMAGTMAHAQGRAPLLHDLQRAVNVALSFQTEMEAMNSREVDVIRELEQSGD